MIGLVLIGLLGTALIGSFAFDWFDGNDGNDEADEEVDTPPVEEGQLLAYVGSELLEGTEGNDTLPAGQDYELAPEVLNLLGGDDTAFIEINDPITVSGGDGDDILTTTGVLNTLEGDEGNDTLTGDDSNLLYGGAGDDVLTFLHGSYDQGEWGVADGGDGDDVINVRADAITYDTTDFGGVDVIGGSGSDEFNIVYELHENIETIDNLEGNFVRISDFEPSEDTLVIEVDRNSETADRDVSVALDQTEDSGTFTSLITLTFDETEDATEAVTTLRVLSASAFTLDEIQLIGV